VVHFTKVTEELAVTGSTLDSWLHLSLDPAADALAYSTRLGALLESKGWVAMNIDPVIDKSDSHFYATVFYRKPSNAIRQLRIGGTRLDSTVLYSVSIFASHGTPCADGL
jgi:hypothetical protein